MLTSKEATRASQTGLDLIEDHQRATLVAQFADPLEVAGRRGHHATLALDRLDEDGGDAGVHRTGGAGG